MWCGYIVYDMVLGSSCIAIQLVSTWSNALKTFCIVIFSLFSLSFKCYFPQNKCKADRDSNTCLFYSIYCIFLQNSVRQAENWFALKEMGRYLYLFKDTFILRPTTDCVTWWLFFKTALRVPFSDATLPFNLIPGCKAGVLPGGNSSMHRSHMQDDRAKSSALTTGNCDFKHYNLWIVSWMKFTYYYFLNLNGQNHSILSFKEQCNNV